MNCKTSAVGKQRQSRGKESSQLPRRGNGQQALRPSFRKTLSERSQSHGVPEGEAAVRAAGSHQQGHRLLAGLWGRGWEPCSEPEWKPRHGTHFLAI